MKTVMAQMKRVRLAVAIFAFGFLAMNVQPSTAEQASGIDVTREHVRITADLANVLVSVTTEYQLPLVAELVSTENPKIDIPMAKATAREVLNCLVSKAPTYEWKEQAGVIHFYHKNVLGAAAHPLNYSLKFFQMPENVSRLKIILPVRLYNAEQGIQEGGAAISAFPSAELERQNLPNKTFRDTIGRDILLAAAAAQPRFSSIIVLPNSHPRGAKDLEYAHRHWFWFATTTHDHVIISMN